ncbi:U7 snRNA-associated Sm-like protein LSm11 [Bicyclus anynana]|uniref:U7 snRNA-associated Sm-like protein LSm11 n=1 Tax=Bicyclus anynana TaxID=110368 RepID=A0A6J1NFR1_BICAN|nr:U7 snRNA-associated Sm-like protein LSm11 [Bicyclus anynana]
MSSTSSSESETSASSSKFDPIKVLYSKKTKVPVKNAPLYDNLQQFESALKYNESQSSSIIPVGKQELVKKREEEKEAKKKEEEKNLAEKNKQRFAQYQGLEPVKRPFRAKNVMTRLEAMTGPLGALKECVDQRLRIKITTRNANGIRGVLHATLVAFDKQWNMALSDVLEIWRRKAPKKRKIPPALGTPVPKGTAASISAVPVVTETNVGGGVLECTRHLPQIMVRGEHVVMVNIVERSTALSQQ